MRCGKINLKGISILNITLLSINGKAKKTQSNIVLTVNTIYTNFYESCRAYSSTKKQKILSDMIKKGHRLSVQIRLGDIPVSALR